MTKRELLMKISTASATEADRIYWKIKATDKFTDKEKEEFLFRAAQRELYMQTFGEDDET